MKASPYVIFVLLMLSALASACGGSITPTQRTATVTATASHAPVGQPPAPAFASPTAVPTAMPAPSLTATRAAALISTPIPTLTLTAISTPIRTPSVKTSPSPVPPPPPLVSIRENRITLKTYPYSKFMKNAYNKEIDFPYQRFDRQAYDASNPQSRIAPVTHKLVIMENEYLKLTFLPDLGGRIYQCIFKPTGNNEFYQNKVIKPSPWGPPEQGGWLAVGGMEWGFPVPEHGYLWGSSWGYLTLPQEDMGSVIIFNGDTEHLDSRVTVSLGGDKSRFAVTHRVENPTQHPVRFQYWSDAMLAPGPANTVGDGLQFIFPVNEMTLHSTGDAELPKPHGALPWPVYKGRDLSFLANWHQWLGAFERPQSQKGFAAVYDHASDEGMVVVFPTDVVRGTKFFGFGWSNPIPPENYTDDGSAYVEIHTGLTPTFWDWITLQPGGSIEWTETWFPVAGIDGLVGADTDGAVNIRRTGDSVKIGLFAARALSGTLHLYADGKDTGHQDVFLPPGSHNWYTFPAVEGALSTRLVDSSGHVILSGDMR